MRVEGPPTSPPPSPPTPSPPSRTKMLANTRVPRPMVGGRVRGEGSRAEGEERDGVEGAERVGTVPDEMVDEEARLARKERGEESAMTRTGRQHFADCYRVPAIITTSPSGRLAPTTIAGRP